MFIGDREIGAGWLTEKRAITDASPRRDCAETAIELATTINAELAEPARCTLPAFSGITLISSNNGAVYPDAAQSTRSSKLVLTFLF